ncbi:MAG: hypothetical protein J4G03_00375 [Gemmatimonadetes bacterium]|nr:hypothetical protein [Gemmatimonadota bacterium]
MVAATAATLVRMSFFADRLERSEAAPADGCVAAVSVGGDSNLRAGGAELDGTLFCGRDRAWRLEQ